MYESPSLVRPAVERLEGSARGVQLAHGSGQTAHEAEFRVYLSETDASYTLKAALPGALKEDIDVRIDGFEVSITSHAIEAACEKDKHCTSPGAGHPNASSHSVWLDCRVDASIAVVNFQDGVLELRLPK